MAGRRRTFCMECRKETAYALHKTLITKTIREKEYQFLITTAYCKECGCEVGVKGILDYNAKEIDEQFRKAERYFSVPGALQTWKEPAGWGTFKKGRAAFII